MRVGIIGLGAIAPIHAKALLSQNQQIVAICDVDVAKGKLFNQTFGLNATFYTDYQQMLDSEQLDVVHVCTPHNLHAQMVCHALERNINVLCEKPLAISFEQLKQIRVAMQTTTAQLGVCFQNRYNSAVLYVKEFLRDKQIKSATANLVWCRDKSYYDLGSWRGTWAEEGGGVMINQAIHYVDMIQWICGMPTSVIAHTSNNSLKGVIEVEDTAFGLFELPNGGNFVINGTNSAKYSFPFFAMFNSGKDILQLTANNIIVNGNFVTRRDGLPIFGKEEWGVGHSILIKEYYRCLQQNEHFPIDFEEGSKAVKLVLKMYQSKGQKISIE